MGRNVGCGECACCLRLVTPETCHAFPFAHLDAAKKKHAVNALVRSNAKLATVRSRILTEIGRSRLLCAVCHQKETRQRNTVGVRVMGESEWVA